MPLLPPKTEKDWQGGPPTTSGTSPGAKREALNKREVDICVRFLIEHYSIIQKPMKTSSAPQISVKGQRTTRMVIDVNADPSLKNRQPPIPNQIRLLQRTGICMESEASLSGCPGYPYWS